MSPRRRIWMVNALVIVLVGLTCTVLGARAGAQNNSQKAR
jgi:hypothetical protein